MMPLQCPTCRETALEVSREHIEATGEMRMRGHKRYPRQPYREAEVCHLICGLKWWSKHPDAIGRGTDLSGGYMR